MKVTGLKWGRLCKKLVGIMFPRPQSMDNSQTTLGDSLHLKQSTYSETLDLNGITVFVKVAGRLWR